MPWVELVIISIPHVIGLHHDLPLVGEIDGCILCCGKHTIKAQKAHESPVSGIVKSASIETLEAVLPDVCRFVGGNRIRHIVVLHAWLLASPDVDCTVGVSVDDLAWNEEVGLSDLRSTLPNTIRKVPQRINGNLHCFVHSKSVDIQTFDPHTGEMNNFVKDTWSPISKAVLDSAEFGKLFLPLRIDSKCSSVAELIKLAIHTADHFGRVFVVIELTSLVPIARKVPRTVIVKFVRRRKVSVNPSRFLVQFVLGEGERCSRVLESFERINVSHGGKGVFYDDPDPLVVNLLDRIAYLGQSAMMMIQNGQVVRAEAIGSPSLIKKQAP